MSWIKLKLLQIFKHSSSNFYIQFFRYIIVGGIAFVADFSTLFLLTEFLNFHYLLSAVFGFIVGLIINYSISVCWVFKGYNRGNILLGLFIFLLTGLIGLAINHFVMWFFTEKIHFYYLFSKIISTVVVLFWNFASRKLILFNKKEAYNG